MAKRRKDTNNSGTKFGICVNDRCGSYKEVREIVRDDFLCEKCGKPLFECANPNPNPKKSNKSRVVGAVLAIALTVLAIVLIVLAIAGKDEASNGGEVNEFQITMKVSSDQQRRNNSDNKENVGRDKKNTESSEKVSVSNRVSDSQSNSDSGSTSEEQSVSPNAKSSAKSSGTLQLGYGTYRGDIKNGKPDGMGRLTYNVSRQIDSRDSRGRVAEPGDYVIGEYSEGRLVQGTWYGSDNTVKGSILIGK